ncbi:MAG TPA: gamma-glutamyltransferase family protein [Candidatus Deferrimicrobiaceae bacterium]|nr:gamma-glutamyltransferase family protein [Candidatus Deferrimicrobiaceae bacterium]
MIRSTLSVTKHTPATARALVAAEHPLGAEVGAGILARGGNAVDAAVATAFAMTVVEPFMSSVAGGGTMLVHMAKRGETVALDFNVQAPAACHESCYDLADGVAQALFPWRRVVDDANNFGPKSVAIPGSVAGLCLALERFGTMELADVLAPAIRLAEQGFEVDWYVTLTTAPHCQELAAFPATARAYLRDGHYVHRPAALAAADVLRQPDLARSLRLIAKDGPGAFYRGAIAQAIDAEMRRTGGFLRGSDLAGYAPRVVEPLTVKYRGLELAFSPGATGGPTAVEMLNVLAQFPSAKVGCETPGGLHLRAEAVRYGFLDRLRHLGDPLAVRVPWRGLASREHAREVAAGLRAAGPRSDAKLPDAWAHDAAVSGLGRGRPAPRGRRRLATEGGDCTTHVCAVDRQRNMVSLTNTAVSLFGSRMVVPGTGILLQNGMLWFDPEPGRANSVAAGKRPVVNMVPALGFRQGAPYLTVGAPGGRKIVSAIPQVIANLADRGDTPQAAIEAPRLHTEGGELWVDDRVGEKSLAALRKMGHDVVAKRQTYGTFYFSRPVAIRVGRRGLEAGLDHLNAAAAAGI